MKQFGNPPLSKRTPLSTNAPISEQFFHNPLFVQISKSRNPPPSPNFTGEETMLGQETLYSTHSPKNGYYSQFAFFICMHIIVIVMVVIS